jgi:hypothetical protein
MLGQSLWWDTGEHHGGYPAELGRLLLLWYLTVGLSLHAPVS